MNRRLTTFMFLLTVCIFSNSLSALEDRVVVIPLGEDAKSLAGGSCLDTEYMKGISPQGEPICASLNDYVNTNCSVYLGWRDACDGCSLAPAKIGRTNGINISNTANCQVSGTNSNCITATTLGQSVQFVGINTDGDVAGDDKFYLGFKCNAPLSD